VTSQFQVLMVVQAVYDKNDIVGTFSGGVAIPNPPTNWFWNVRIGDKFRFNDSGRYYTVVGPMTLFNPELLVNDGLPGNSSLTEYYGFPAPQGGKVSPSPEFLFLVNGVDDSGFDPVALVPLPKDGYPDNGFDGINWDLNNGYNFDGSNRPLVDDIAEWVEVETWLGSQLPLSTKTGTVGIAPNTFPVPATFKWTIQRRPVPSPGAREVSLPAGATIDLTTWDTTRERSRLPVDPLNGTVDILVDQAGKVVPTTLYSNPSSAGMDQNFFHFWIADRSDVYDPWTVAGTTFPSFPGLPMPSGSPGYAGTQFLTKDRQLVTLFTRTGQIVSNSAENFDATGTNGGPNAPYLDAQYGYRESK
jgi:hypothetical protein